MYMRRMHRRDASRAGRNFEHMLDDERKSEEAKTQDSL